MILPDVNLLVYAYNTDAPLHQHARCWWEACLDGSKPVALNHLGRWLERPSVLILQPGPRHFEVGAFYWTAQAPEIVNSGREEQGSVSL